MVLAPLQEHRRFAVVSPLDPDVLLLRRMTGTEGLGRLFRYELDLLSESHTLDPAELIGEHMSVRVDVRGGAQRYFDGIISQFSYAGSYGQYARYHAVLRPWLWFLTRAADCRVFQGDSTIDILRQLFEKHSCSDHDLSQVADPGPREYCVQYRESDFNFVSRLLEEDGISYYFTHEEKKHKLILSDGVNCHATVTDYDSITYFPEGSDQSTDTDHITRWCDTMELQSGVYVHTDYDFTKPRAPLETRANIPQSHTQAEIEVFDYPGLYKETTPGETIAGKRIEELQAGHTVMNGGGTIRGLGAGSLFALTDHPRDSLNLSYLVTAARYRLANTEFETVHGHTAGELAQFECDLTAIEERIPFRPPRVTPKPTVEGPQTATVTGSGEDPWTDEFGRIKVHFHWDRTGPTTEESSCWVRVSQLSAGKNWGGMFVPHPGQEVIVDFLEGDPDQPICTGRVYNADNMPPKTLATHKDVSIIRDKFGNEIQFNSTPGSESLSLYSPSHDSGIILGQSSVKYTMSDSKSISIGDKWSSSYGNSVSFTRGASFAYTKGVSAALKFASSATFETGTSVSAFLGGKLGISIGASLSINAAINVTWGWARTLNYNKAEYARVSSKDIKHDSDAEVWLCGGPTDTSLVKAGPDDITLAFGTGASRTSGRDYGPIGAAIATAGTLINTAGQAGSMFENQANAIQSTFQDFNYDPETKTTTGSINMADLEPSVTGWVLEGAGMAASIAGGIVGVSGADIADPKHTTEKSKVILDDDGVFVVTGDKKNAQKSTKGVTLNAQNKCYINVQDDGKIVISAEGEVYVMSKDVIHFGQKMVCDKDGQWKGSWSNPSLEANK